MNRRSELKRSGGLSRSSGTKRKPSMASFWAEVTRDGVRLKPCALAHRGPCRGILDAHHFILKARLPTDAAKTDPRNGVCLCRHHHDQVTNARMLCPRPPELDAFLADHGLLPSGRPDPRRRAA